MVNNEDAGVPERVNGADLQWTTGKAEDQGTKPTAKERRMTCGWTLFKIATRHSSFPFSFHTGTSLLAMPPTIWVCLPHSIC